jgi:hypothetical protein
VNRIPKFQYPRSSSQTNFGLFVLFVLLSMLTGSAIASIGGTPLDVAGYLDFSYGSNVKERPTAEKPESKLWWNDGLWWGILYNHSTGKYHIYYLNWSRQIWVDTGTAVDDREDSKADALWDEDVKKLYVVSHFRFSNPAHTSNEAEKGRIYRYSYDLTQQKYLLDGGFPVNVNADKTETLVVDKDSTGRLWVTYVSKDLLSSSPIRYAVFLNTSSDGGSTWGTPFIIPVTGKFVDLDDISSVIAFRDNGGDKIGVMWSNQITNRYYFATHDDDQAPEDGWNLEVFDTSPYSLVADDHINLAKSKNGQVFAAVKSGNTLESEPLIGLMARDVNGNSTFHVFNNVDSKDTRPIVLVHDDEDEVYVFVSSNPVGGRICYKSATIPVFLSNLSFPDGNCEDVGSGGASQFIADSTYINLNDATSTKQNLNNTTGLVVLASDDPNGDVYVHNVKGDPPPMVTGRYPEPGVVLFPKGAAIVVSFSKQIDPDTLMNGAVAVEDMSGQVLGNLTYDSQSRSAKFMPSTPLQVGETFVVTVTTAVKDTSGQALFRTVIWSFTVAKGGILYLPVISGN